MIRFDLVIATMGRSELFWDAWENLKNFDQDQDRIIFFDCSPDPQQELEKCRRYLKKLGLNRTKFCLYHRRNWTFNQGCQLDYIRLIGDNRLEQPKLTFFLQDHYLNKLMTVRGDTIPDDEVIDLKQVISYFEKHPDTVYFSSRVGFRLATSVPDVEEFLEQDYAEYNRTTHRGSVDISFVVDGSNYIVDPGYYLRDYRQHPSLYWRGNGSYNFAHVWETRICQILYEQNLSFYDDHRKLAFRNAQELKRKFPAQGDVWHYFHHMPQAYIFYGRDLWRYQWLPKNLTGLRRFTGWLIVYVEECLRGNYDRTLTLEWSQNDRSL